MKSLFPNQAWTDFALSEIKANGLDQISPVDGPEFRIDGTAESWVHLLAAMAKHESSFRPHLTYSESGDLAGVVSVGLLQVSEGSSRRYGKFARSAKIRAEIEAVTTESLKDPFVNIRVAATILSRWVKADGVIACPVAPWLGGAKYWSVLRKGAPKVKATLKAAAENMLKASALKGVGTPANLTKGKSIKSKPGLKNVAPQEVAMAFQARENLGSGCNWIFEVDFSIHAKNKRLFVYDIAGKKLFKFKCAHGIGGKNRVPHDGKIREVSNVPGSHCSSLGVIRTGVPYDSDAVGEALRLHGLSPTNSNILKRGVVLHGGAYVSDNKAGSDTSIPGRSHGCLVVDDQYIDHDAGGELIEWLKGGSIGVAHYAGAFDLKG